jgi:hypothetical protein
MNTHNSAPRSASTSKRIGMAMGLTTAAIAVIAACSAAAKPAEPGCDNAGVNVKIGGSIYCSCPGLESNGERACQADGTFGECEGCLPAMVVETCKENGKTYDIATRVDCTCDTGEMGSKICKGTAGFSACKCTTMPPPKMDAGPVKDSSTPPMDSGPSGLCGNGKIDSGEICDAKDSRFCSATCQPIANPAGPINCGAPQVVHVWAGKEFDILRVSTRTYDKSHSTENTCNPSDVGGFLSKDRVFEVRVHGAGDLFITTVKADFDHQLFLQTSCDDSMTQLTGGDGCSDQSTGSGPEALLPAVKDGDKLYLWLDGTLNTEGTLDIHFEML